MLQEEKKDNDINSPVRLERAKEDKDKSSGGEAAQEKDIEDDCDDEDDYEDYIEDLPHELRKLSEITFRSHNQLEEELVKRGFSDLPVELHPITKKAHLKITSGAHDTLTDYYTRLFNKFHEPHWESVAVDGSTNVFMQPAAGRARRKPDIAFWGPNKCFLGPELLLEPKRLAQPPLIFQKTREQTEKVNPDVVVQFSWGNTDPYEFHAINDLMNLALVTYPAHLNQLDNEAPRLGFLIKIRVSSKRAHDKRKIIRQIDVYRVPRGATAEDAKANRNGATLQTYVPGGPDFNIEVTAADLGVALANVHVNHRAPFCMSVQRMYERLI